MTPQEAAERIREIQQEMQPLVDELFEIANALNDGNALHYVVAPLQIHTSAFHTWVSRDQNLTDWAERLEGDEDDN